MVTKSNTIASTAALLFLCGGCAPISYHAIPKESLIEQAKSQGIRYQVPVNNLTAYDFSGLHKVKCINKDNKPVYVSTDFNSQLEIYTKSRGKVNMYFTTVSLVDGTLYGLRSRILNLRRAVKVDDIERVELYSEFKREENMPE